MVENRASFFQRLAGRVTPTERVRIEVAYMLAKYAHRAQHRKERNADGSLVRYFEHCRAVALILMEFGVVVVAMLCAALLHDSIEDTDEVTPEMLEEIFGSDVARMVILLSKVPKDGYYERLDSCGDWRVIFIKLADRLANLRTLEQCDPAFQRKQAEETLRVLLPIFARTAPLVPMQYRSAYDTAVEEARTRSMDIIARLEGTTA